jgi:hypothetical protein
MEHTLGQFGDCRLKKGGPSCCAVSSKLGNPAFGFVRLVATGLAKFVSGGSCAIRG